MSIRFAAACAVPLLLLALPAQAQMKELGDVLGQLLGVPNDPSLARCESVGGKTQTCAIAPGTRVEFVRQLSKTACTRGKTLIMESDKVTVSGGCRAEFRVIGQQTADGSGDLEQSIGDALRTTVRKPQGEYGSLYEVRVLNAKQQSASSSRERVYTGTAQAVWGGRSYPLEYTVRQEVSSGRFLNVDYQYNSPAANDAGGSGTWVNGTALDAEAREALARAIEADYRKRGDVRSVQVVINTAYREQQVTRSDYRFNGRYGVSINDGDWKTDGYEGRVFLPRNTVSDLQLGARPR